MNMNRSIPKKAALLCACILFLIACQKDGNPVEDPDKSGDTTRITYKGQWLEHRFWLDQQTGLHTSDSVYNSSEVEVTRWKDSIQFEYNPFKESISFMVNDSNAYHAHTYYYGFNCFCRSTFRIIGDSLKASYNYFGGTAHGTPNDVDYYFNGSKK